MSSNFWIENAEDFLHFEHPSERDVLHPLIIDKINKLDPKTYLDFGAGDGRMSAKINSAIPIDIFDISSKMIERAKEGLSGRLKNVFSSIDKIPSDYYELIVCSMVLLCIDNEKDYKSALASISKSLKKDGKAIFSTTHPCFRQTYFSDFYTEFSVGKQFNYFKEGKPFAVTIHDQEKINKVTFEDYHWSLNFTINSIINAGLNIIEIIETTDDLLLPNHNNLVSPFIIIITEKK